MAKTYTGSIKLKTVMRCGKTVTTKPTTTHEKQISSRQTKTTPTHGMPGRPT